MNLNFYTIFQDIVLKRVQNSSQTFCFGVKMDQSLRNSNLNFASFFLLFDKFPYTNDSQIQQEALFKFEEISKVFIEDDLIEFTEQDVISFNLAWTKIIELVSFSVTNDLRRQFYESLERLLGHGKNDDLENYRPNKLESMLFETKKMNLEMVGIKRKEGFLVRSSKLVINYLSSILESNDPIARSITLLILGSLRMVVYEMSFVHYKIVKSMQSHHPIEMNAAIEALNRILSFEGILVQSKSKNDEFVTESNLNNSVWNSSYCDPIQDLANVIFEKVGLILFGSQHENYLDLSQHENYPDSNFSETKIYMVDYGTSMDQKIQLLSLFIHLGWFQTQYAQIAFNLCKHVLDIYPLNKNALKIIEIVFLIAKTEIVSLPSQVATFLIQIAKNEFIYKNCAHLNKDGLNISFYALKHLQMLVESTQSTISTSWFPDSLQLMVEIIEQIENFKDSISFLNDILKTCLHTNFLVAQNSNEVFSKSLNVSSLTPQLYSMLSHCVSSQDSRISSLSLAILYFISKTLNNTPSNWLSLNVQCINRTISNISNNQDIAHLNSILSTFSSFLKMNSDPNSVHIFVTIILNLFEMTIKKSKNQKNVNQEPLLYLEASITCIPFLKTTQIYIDSQSIKIILNKLSNILKDTLWITNEAESKKFVDMLFELAFENIEMIEHKQKNLQKQKFNDFLKKTQF